MERYVDVAPGVRLWAEDIAPHADATEDRTASAEPLLLVMGANASGVAWPDPLIARLAERHRVIRYDHRDTGRSTWAFDEHPYAISDLGGDAIAVLDAFGVERAHVVGMSMGGVLVQLLLLDHPDRLLSATVLCTTALGSGLAAGDPADAAPVLPDPDPALLALWQEMDRPRDRDAEIAWRVEHWRLLNGSGTPFDAEEFRALEERVVAHAGRHDNPAAHARAARTGLDRGAELAEVEVPTLVIEAPEDPINPPPHSGHLSRAIGGGRLVRVPGMGHALNSTVIEPVAAAILTQTAAAGTAAAPS
ncbi:alpha/beta fold hydrolase [Pseudonocardia acidicola]|uniref:Alpha/beta fold hydrolase n=1 Tax=Pseudonocardia acidicola TaxID=2724939 RepID=A0ABX1SID7_9PSEU|nr:alpha/beta fold hydrolase [Pseudonocardia acidicola]